MRLLDISFKRPERNLAFDEVLLNNLKSGRGQETLRFWESPVPFVVLGVGQVLRDHVHERACAELGVPIMRRCSAGGCVLQGPGSLNFSLVLTHEQHPDIKTVRGSYCYILGKLTEAFNRHDIKIKHKGISDLAIGGKKVSGNAQRRRKNCILHHGTLLYEPDTELMGRCLREPADRPQYRGRRKHGNFMRSIPATPEQLREIACEAFAVTDPAVKPKKFELETSKRLAKEMYAAEAWIRRR